MRLRSHELVLLAIVVPVWLAGFGLFVVEGVRGGPHQTHLLVGPPDGADAYPTVARYRPGYVPRPGGVGPGDRLIRFGSHDLRGAMPWTVYAHLFAEAVDGRVEVAYERAGVPATSSEVLVSSGSFWRKAVLTLVFAATALLILLRVPGSLLGKSFAWAALVWTGIELHFLGANVHQSYAYYAMRTVTGCLWAPLMVRAAFHFPEGAWPRDRRRPLWPWLFAALGLTWTSKWMGIPFPHEVGVFANPFLGFLVLATLMAITTRNYRRADALGKRQVRWVILGVYLGLTPVLLGNLMAAARPELTELWYLSQVTLVIVPISILIGVTRSNLFDVDRLISGAASYTLVVVGLAVGALTIVPWLAEQASGRVGLDPGLVQVGVAAVLALGLLRLEPVLRPAIDRTFFSERLALQTGIDRLVADLTGARDITTLANLVGQRLDALLRPASCVFYARGEDAFAPIYARGSAITPHFGLGSPLLGLLAERTSAVEVEPGRSFGARLDPGDRAALGSLAAAVLLPVARGGDLVAFLVLGRKGSGDVYTPTDLALLGLVGASLSTTLTRLGGEALLREARALQEEFRQYVPPPVAAQLAEGRTPEAGERAVSILFADLRGYTSLAEGRRAEEIFSTVQRYTDAVTRAVSSHGGTVVDFSGDGIMAVFGAPDPLPDKERRALEAARAIVESVAELPAPSPEARATRLTVGVGLATGLAFVGPLPSADRYTWSAIGNTTNLAARLQALTKDLGASVVIDEATRHAVGSDAADLVPHPRTPIRGLSDSRDVFALERRGEVAG